MEYYFYGRLIVSPQVRIQTQNGPGFTSLKECELWCRNNMFNFVIYHLENGKKVYDIVVE